jgi:dolichol-phosphate mannosyltransferase
MKQVLDIDFIRFCMVGTTGFVINFIILTLLYKVIGLPIFVAQLLASEIALFSNFLLHNYWTYKRRRVSKNLTSLLWQFHVTSWVAIMGSAILVSVGVKVLNLDYLVALILSSSIALTWNFLWTKLVIWRHEHEPQIEEN